MNIEAEQSNTPDNLDDGNGKNNKARAAERPRQMSESVPLQKCDDVNKVLQVVKKSGRSMPPKESWEGKRTTGNPHGRNINKQLICQSSLVYKNVDMTMIETRIDLFLLRV